MMTRNVKTRSHDPDWLEPRDAPNDKTKAYHIANRKGARMFRCAEITDLWRQPTSDALIHFTQRVLAVCAGLIIVLCATLESANAGDELFGLLFENASNGRITEGLGYTNMFGQTAPTPGNKYRVFGNEDSGWVTIRFLDERLKTKTKYIIGFQSCGDSIDTNTMLNYLKNRPLQHSDIKYENDPSFISTESTTIDEIKKNVRKYDENTIMYSHSETTTHYTQGVGETHNSEQTDYYEYLDGGWCVWVGANDELYPTTVETLLKNMRIAKQNALEILGVQDSSIAGNDGSPAVETNTPAINNDTDFPGQIRRIPGITGMAASMRPDQELYRSPVIAGRETRIRAPQPELAIAAGTLAAGGIAGLGAWLMMGQAGVGRREMQNAVGDLARGRLPSDGFDDWKARYEAMGWTYREEDGVAVFDPPPGYSEQAAAPPPVIETHRDGETNAETGEVWSDEDGGWIGRNLYDQEKRRAGEIAAIEERNRQAVEQWDSETQALDKDIASSQRDRAARAKADKARRVRISNKLTRILEEDGVSTAEVERMRREGDTLGLETLYENIWRDRMAKTSAEAAVFNRNAKIYHAGELVSKAVLAGSKAGMMVVAGPAGYIPALVGSGVLRSAEEGATAYVKSDGDKRKLGTALVSGFFAGAKDGVVGRFTGLPRTGNVTKILLPAAADAGETYIRTGDVKATMTTGLLSAAGGAAGTKMDNLGSAVARETGQAATGMAIGAAGAVVNGGNITDGAMDGLANSVGGRMGQHMVSSKTPMTRQEIQMDLEYKAKIADARNRIDTFDKAVASGDPARIKTSLQDVLEHREAKVLMKGQDVDPGLKSSFSELTQEHRTRPVMDGTAEALNRQTVTGPDGIEQPRFVIRDTNGVERPVTGADFASGSGKPGEPGVDLDMYPNSTIIDKATGRPAKGADVDQAVSESCAKLGIDRRSQEVNVTGMKGTEDLTMRPGETPEQFYARVATEKTVSAAEGTGAAEVATHKLDAADDLHGDGLGSSALAEKTRGVMKDKSRLLDPLIGGDGKAQIPEVFRRMEPIKRKSAMGVLQQLADGKTPPGTANAQFRQLTDMDIDQALPKIAGWSESMGKWESGSPGGAPAGPSVTGPTGGSNLQKLAIAFIRKLDAEKKAK
jgi:hypothetical protein